MEWNSEIQDNFRRIMEDIPDGFKTIASQMIKLKAEEIAEKRDAKEVQEGDLMDALLAVTPNSFRPLMFQSVKKIGIDLEKYTQIEEVSEAWGEVPNYLHKDTLHLLWQLTERCNSFDIENTYSRIRSGNLDYNPFLLHIPTNIDETAAPPGKSTIILLMSASYKATNSWVDDQGNRIPQYPAEKEKIARKMIERAEGLIPGLQNHIEVQEIVTPLTFQRYLLNPKGAWYGAMRLNRSFGPICPGYKTPIENIFVAGNAVSENGLPGSMISGYSSAKAVLKSKW